jgi:hypothetical protein
MPVNGTAEPTTALNMIEDNSKPGSTVGADKNSDTADLSLAVVPRCTPHISQNNTNHRSAIDARSTGHPGYRISTIKRKRMEEPFGWIKTVEGLRKTNIAVGRKSGGLCCHCSRLQSHSHPQGDNSAWTVENVAQRSNAAHAASLTTDHRSQVIGYRNSYGIVIRDRLRLKI